MPNSYVNKVQFVRNGTAETLIDLTADTVTAATLMSGYTAHDASGAPITGTASGGGGTGGVTQDQDGYLVLDDDPPAGPTLITKSITQNGTYSASSDSADGYSSVTVNVSGGSGGGGNISDPIRFFDYDGTLVASYTAVPASLPSVPTHTGLTNGAWNYTLQEVTTQFNSMGTCDVGANYETASGATEIDIELQDGRLHPYLSLAVKGEVSIDWGDNTTPDTVTGTSFTTRKSDIHHEYAQGGKYTIKISRTSGDGYSLYCTSAYSLLNKNSGTANANRVYSNCVQTVRVGAYCRIGNYAFSSCYSLASVSIPSGVTSIGNSAFYYCYALVFVSIPSEVTSIGSSAFQYCYSITSVSIPSGVTSIGSSEFYYCSPLTSVSIPSGVTSIGTSAFYGCYSLALVNIPSGVTSIGNSAFYDCYGASEYHFTRTDSVPTLGTTAFNNIQSDCVIYVPSSKLNDYKTAENWVTYASYMVGE